MTPHITIELEEYEALLEDSKFLRALEAAGVDNWEGYEFAVEDVE
jgi:hypothetical protein